jgi:hypothetical protein
MSHSRSIARPTLQRGAACIPRAQPGVRRLLRVSNVSSAVKELNGVCLAAQATLHEGKE